MKTTMLIVTLGGALAAAIAAAVWMWMELDDVRMSVWGVVALIGGALATLGVGGGLMALVFYSSRHGYDDLDR